MLVTIRATAFELPQSAGYLLNLFNWFADGRHTWAPDDESIEAARKYFELHAPFFAGTSTELAHKTLVAAAWSSTEQRPAAVIENGNLEDTVSDLGQPAVIVVEDLLNDGRFIQAMAQVFGYSDILDALAKNWVVLRHSGGERLELVASAERQLYKLHVRVFALLDSDRWQPGQHTKSHVKAERLIGEGVTVHVLELREAENYAPNKVLATCGIRRESSKKLAALKSLSRDQRGYYDMKHGFGHTEMPPKIRPEQSVLYQNVPEVQIRKLRGGFGTSILKQLETISAHLTLNDFEHPSIKVSDEIHEMLSKIRSII